MDNSRALACVAGGISRTSAFYPGFFRKIHSCPLIPPATQATGGCLLASSRFYYLYCFDSPLLLCYVSVSDTEELEGEDSVFINLLVGCF